MESLPMLPSPHDMMNPLGMVLSRWKQKDADNAKEKGDKQVLDGRQLRVEIAQDRTDFPARRGRGRYGPHVVIIHNDVTTIAEAMEIEMGDKGRDEGRFDRERPMSQYAERGPRREFRRDQDGYGQDRGYGRDKEYQQGGRYERRVDTVVTDRRYEREGDRYGRDGGYNRGAGYPREGGHNAPQRYHHWRAMTTSDTATRVGIMTINSFGVKAVDMAVDIADSAERPLRRTKKERRQIDSKHPTINDSCPH
ncbi:hypothetical protein BLNAU_7868 [Blattamonas nauphoetae]|uniref:Uncharacterized protein n=1 Tax=Blattamonas nauphoetae TaxID=2049346 RepID=A0ABQ9XZZ8_9EUKA|nr:hypothetical protein BLNAU_7868 [Blattamonas nauphoetae]